MKKKKKKKQLKKHFAVTRMWILEFCLLSRALCPQDHRALLKLVFCLYYKVLFLLDLSDPLFLVLYATEELFDIGIYKFG